MPEYKSTTKKAFGLIQTGLILKSVPGAVAKCVQHALDSDSMALHIRVMQKNP